MSETSTLAPLSAGSTDRALSYEAPFLIEKLRKDHVVETAEEAHALFREVKRWLVLVTADGSVAWNMYSLRVDEIWHQFVLFTRQYTDFCTENFGFYVQHAPSNSPEIELKVPRTPSTFDLFADRYRELFGEPLPDLWYDDRNVTSVRRIVNPSARTGTVRDAGDMVELLDPHGEVVFAVDRFARPALEFIANTGTFFVRELPGELDDEQRIALVSTLVEFKLVQLAT
ncbi:glycine-rich domain-containing protein [Nocardia neocaledoniensis]|uniref:glycine-rich domain-containing protein n=1 Tax=Nocardia neocaledoniensis TaxID=236511 RepID=UPI0024561CFD|nr:hypothetical protein [Nocardia neocaledoniensis]